MNADHAKGRWHCFVMQPSITALLICLFAVSCDRNPRYVLHTPLKIKTASGQELTLPVGTYVETRMIKGHQVEVLAFGTTLDSEVEKAGDRK
jgi:hypothetical protein